MRLRFAPRRCEAAQKRITLQHLISPIRIAQEINSLSDRRSSVCMALAR
jgi:hypothetical protein